VFSLVSLAFRLVCLLVRVLVWIGRQMALNGLLGACLPFLNGYENDFVGGNAALRRLVLPCFDRFLRRVNLKPVNKGLKHAGMS
jgi:hypothetical protein